MTNWDKAVSIISNVFVTFFHVLGGLLPEKTSISMMLIKIWYQKFRAIYRGEHQNKTHAMHENLTADL